MEIVITKKCCEGVITEWSAILCDLVAIRRIKVFGITVWKDVVYCGIVSIPSLEDKIALEKCIEHVNKKYPNATIILDDSVKELYDEITKGV